MLACSMLIICFFGRVFEPNSPSKKKMTLSRFWFVGILLEASSSKNGDNNAAAWVLEAFEKAPYKQASVIQIFREETSVESGFIMLDNLVATVE